MPLHPGSEGIQGLARTGQRFPGVQMLDLK